MSDDNFGRNSHLNTLDRLDFEIMNHLRDDGRKSFAELAETLGVSPGTIRNRYARLQNEEVLQVYGRIHPEHVGFITYAHILIDVRPSNRIDAILETIATYPEVCFLARMMGDFDVVVDVMCKDNDHLNSLTNERIHPLEGVFKTRVNMYTQLVKVVQPDVSGYFLTENSNGS